MLSRLFSGRLSAKVLAMTIAFVMLAELVILIPSAAMYRQDWLAERAQSAGLLTLALTGVPDYEASETLVEQFVKDTDVVMLAAKRDGMTELVLGMPPVADEFELVDLTVKGRLPRFRDAFRAFFGDDTGYLRVQSKSPVEGQDNLEFIVPKEKLSTAMWDYAQRIFGLSLAIAIITGGLIYLALSSMIVRPIKSLAQGLSDFRDDPETRRSNMPPSKRKDEIGQLQREFYDMKQGVRASFKQRERLASLGLAVAKINHDLRNVFTSAQLVSDRLAMDKDERVANIGQRLVRTVDRGIKLCTDTLGFSSVKDDPPEYEPIRISFLLGEVASDTVDGADSTAGIAFNNRVPTDMLVSADIDHTYRIFNNLFRNASQAMAGMTGPADSPQLIVTGAKEGDKVKISVTDTGPGIPQKAQDHLFEAFISASGHGSTGLGLTISKELAADQGGDLVLGETGPDGTTFIVTLKAD